MLTHQLITRSNVGEVVHYYDDGVDDYYSKKGEGASWQGRGAEALSLGGPAGTSRFHELLAGRVDPSAPVSRSSTRNDRRNRIALDLTFSAPKSVSMQALIAGDPRIIAAHDLAVERALVLAEERAQARHKVNGKSRVEETKNLVVPKFRHETSRARDPQLLEVEVTTDFVEEAPADAAIVVWIEEYVTLLPEPRKHVGVRVGYDDAVAAEESG